MKKQHKTLIIILCILAGIIIFASVINYISPEQENNDIKQEEKAKDYITLDDFNKISTGMSYEEVKNIIGNDGTIVSDSQVSDTHMIIYSWYGKDKISNANFSFQNDKLINKTQIGLE